MPQAGIRSYYVSMGTFFCLDVPDSNEYIAPSFDWWRQIQMVRNFPVGVT